VQFERKITAYGGSTGMTLPTDLLKYLNLEQGDRVYVKDEMGKHGPFITIWKKEGDTNATNTKPAKE